MTPFAVAYSPRVAVGFVIHVPPPAHPRPSSRSCAGNPLFVGIPQGGHDVATRFKQRPKAPGSFGTRRGSP